MNKARLLELLLAGQRENIRFSDFVRLIEAFGFLHKRTTGSHLIFRHPGSARTISVQPKGGCAKGYQISQFLAIVEEHDLKLERDEDA